MHHQFGCALGLLLLPLGVLIAAGATLLALPGGAPAWSWGSVTRELLPDILFGAFIGGCCAWSGGECVTGKLRARALGLVATLGSLLIPLAPLAVVVTEGLTAALVALFQERVPGAPVGFGTHWRAHAVELPAALFLGGAVALLTGGPLQPVARRARATIVGAAATVFALHALFLPVRMPILTPPLLFHGGVSLILRLTLDLPLAILAARAALGAPPAPVASRWPWREIVAVVLWVLGAPLPLLLAFHPAAWEGWRAHAVDGGLPAVVAGLVCQHVPQLAVIMAAAIVAASESASRNKVITHERESVGVCEPRNS